MTEVPEFPERIAKSRLLPNLASLFLTGSGSIILAWVGWLTWYDITTWNKDIALIFFGSRIGEAISLGIGIRVIHYFLISWTLIISGLLTFLRSRSIAFKLHLGRLQPQKEKEEKKDKEEHVVKPLVEEKIFSGCLHHFGYLASRPENAPIPQECIICQRLGDCMVATLFPDILRKALGPEKEAAEPE